jgi:hypothetical protein
MVAFKQAVGAVQESILLPMDAFPMAPFPSEDQPATGPLLLPHASSREATTYAFLFTPRRPFAIDYAAGVSKAWSYPALDQAQTPHGVYHGATAIIGRTFQSLGDLWTRARGGHSNITLSYSLEIASDGLLIAGSAAAGSVYLEACISIGAAILQLVGTQQIQVMAFDSEPRPALPTLPLMFDTGERISGLRAPSDETREPTPAAAPAWAGQVERRIRDSVRREGRQRGENDGRWIGQDVADAAVEVVRQAADLIPSEPFIYASKKGDLVFEASGDRGSLTMIVGPTFALFFAVIDEQSETRRADLTIGWPARLRKELQELSELLRTGRHAAVDSNA